jgi:hypothetical protein
VSKLQALLDAALFEPGHHLPLSSAGREPVDVPTSEPRLLGTPHHLLLNELVRSPDTLLGCVLQLAQQAVGLDTGSFASSTTTIILYVVRLCARIDNYLSFVLAHDGGTHDAIPADCRFRQLELPAGGRERLEEARGRLRGVLWGELRRLMLRWYHKLARELDGADEASESLVDANTKRMCSIHGHLLLMLRNAAPSELTAPLVSSISCACVFLSTRHRVPTRGLEPRTSR